MCFFSRKAFCQFECEYNVSFITDAEEKFDMLLGEHHSWRIKCADVSSNKWQHISIRNFFFREIMAEGAVKCKKW